jgi:integrase
LATHAIVRTALKRSRGRRRRAAVPIIPELAALLERLRARPRKPGVETVLVNSFGRPWGSPVSLGDRFHRGPRPCRDRRARERRLAPDRPKHLHDLRGTYVTVLCRKELTDAQIAEIIAWSPQNVSQIRKAYVDDAAVVVAIGRRLSAAPL